MYQVEHDEMFAAIRAGKPINNGERRLTARLLALMGRTAAYTGQVITPDMILNSKEDLSPPTLRVRPARHAPHSGARQLPSLRENRSVAARSTGLSDATHLVGIAPGHVSKF